ncbi:MAG: hypothetical protein EON87_12100 [Brevundimonas sp.]|nr:MAG: hypothetical protein EON87_12100 [Brevundimonas sp.]
MALAAAMALLPLTNPSGAPLAGMFVLILAAVANVAVIAAVVFFVIDLCLRALGGAGAWIYGAACGATTLAICAGLQMLFGNPINWLIVMGLALIPAVAGGWVMGRFRS